MSMDTIYRKVPENWSVKIFMMKIRKFIFLWIPRKLPGKIPRNILTNTEN